VRVQVADIAPQISGQIIKIDVHDNEAVHVGDILYEIDPFDFQVALAQADAMVSQQHAALIVSDSNARRRAALTTLSTSVEEKQQYTGTAEQSAATYASAIASQSRARINLQRTKIRSTVNGIVTNLQMRVGNYATTGTANIQIIDTDSYWIDGYFEETKLEPIRLGDPATVVLLGYHQPIMGHVESINRGIATSNASPSTQGLPSVDPVYTWVRLAQRIPVHIHIDQVPQTVLLAAGMTATVTVHPQHPVPAYDTPGRGLIGWFRTRFERTSD